MSDGRGNEERAETEAGDRFRAAYEVLIEPFIELFLKAEVAQTSVEQGRQALAEQAEQSRQMLAASEQMVALSEAQREAYLAELRKIVPASISWRITRPLRGAKRVVLAARRCTTQGAWALRVAAAMRQVTNHAVVAMRRTTIRAANAGIEAATHTSAWWRLMSVGRALCGVWHRS